MRCCECTHRRGLAHYFFFLASNGGTLRSGMNTGRNPRMTWLHGFRLTIESTALGDLGAGWFATRDDFLLCGRGALMRAGPL
jgi:hypothetical protein